MKGSQTRFPCVTAESAIRVTRMRIAARTPVFAVGFFVVGESPSILLALINRVCGWLNGTRATALLSAPRGCYRSQTRLRVVVFSKKIVPCRTGFTYLEDIYEARPARREQCNEC